MHIATEHLARWPKNSGGKISLSTLTKMYTGVFYLTKIVKPIHMVLSF